MAKKEKTKERPIPNDDNIEMFLHCKQCLEEKPSGISPMEWSKVQAGWTKIGLQIWCNRHEVNICHIDFQGMKHPANMTRSTSITVKE
jgi:hypothetical protein